ncbi:hypothetical protein NF212_14325 [Parasalinivibrio latis]|uniref:hypothetical protein n=1 Tax=Parasalinivibrio latis TaxID=2952610 RepID=UPI0030DE8C38
MKKSSITLVTSGLLFSAVAFAAETDYSACLEGKESAVCEAYMAGLKQSSPVSEELENAAKQNSFLSRALEQRAGERYRKPVKVANVTP